MKRIFRVVMCMILITGLAYTPVTIPQVINTNAVAVAEAATVKINKKKATIYKGTTVQLKIQGTKKKVTWTSGNKKVATVTKNGKVIGKKAGTTTIKGKVNGKTYKCKVTVKAVPKLSKTKLSLKKGNTYKLMVKGFKIGKVKWSTSNKNVATVVAGKVTAKKPGTATIRAKVGGKTLTCKVTVPENPKINFISKKMKVGETFQLKVTGTAKTVKWTTSNKAVATVVKGKVTAVSAGTATITATAGTKKLKCKVTVSAKEDPKETYTITYVLNKGTNADSNPEIYTEGDSVLLADPTYENHAFKGWYTDKACTQLIEQITPEIKGNLTLYAKWHLAALNIQGDGMEDMIWSWWYYPQVISDVSDGTKVHWGYATKDGYCGVAQYDEKTGQTKKTVLKKAAADDHNGMALTLLDDKRIMCVYASGHNVDNEMHIRISDRPLDISSFSEDIVLESAGKTCYGQILRSSGKYYLFYRVNNSSWAYRSSVDGREWTAETIVVKAPMQYYCKIAATTTDEMLRIVMYSNPAQTAPEIRMGFLNTKENAIYNSDGKTRMLDSSNYYDTFQVIQNNESGKKHRLFDVAVTDVESPRFLFASFTKKTNVNNAVYYLHDAGKVYEICEGGRYLMDANYQLGAAFVDNDTIVTGRNQLGSDYIELYKFNGTAVSYEKTLAVQTGIGFSRNARPIVDVNGKAILWHNGYYDYKSYTKFDTDAQMYLVDSGRVVAVPKTGMDGEELGRVKPENVSVVRDYSNKLFAENIMEDYTQGGFTWDIVPSRKTGWIYYSGFMLEAFLHTDFEKTSDEIREFYNQYIVTDENGHTKILKFTSGELDAVMPAVGIIELIRKDVLTESEEQEFVAAANYVYNQLENQTVYPQAGGLLLHSQMTNGEPKKHWTKWNICLDGVYMSQLFTIRLAQMIEEKGIEIKSVDGSVVTSQQLWDDIYNRLSFIMDNMVNKKTGLLNHGYSVGEKVTNEASWSRGIGWFMMALVEAAENMPDPDKRAKLVEYYNQQMTAIIEWQDPDSFLWYNVTDGKEEYFCEVKTDNGVEVIYNKPESSGSAMFTYCLLRGYHNGLLKDEHFREAGLRGFNALVETKITEDGLIDIYRSSSVTADKNKYQVNGYVVNEAKGIAPLILASKYAY